MAKPILIFWFKNYSFISIKQLAETTQVLSREYHVILMEGDENKVQMFSDKEIKPIELDELKKILNIE